MVYLLISVFLLLHNGSMANNTTQYSIPPAPVPTPYQPVAQGGNQNIPVGSTGPSYSQTTPGPYITYGQNSGGMTNPANQGSTALSGNWAGQQSTQPYTQTSTPTNQNSNNNSGSSSQQQTDWSNTSNWGFWRDGNYFQTPQDYENWKRQQPGGDVYNQMINETFGSTMGYLDQNEKLIGDAKTAAEKAAEADLIANQAQLGTNRQQTMGQLDTQMTKGKTQKEDAFAQARRLYDELQRGNVQRFGGASSAGQAASEIQGAEAQRQFGSTNRQFAEFTQQIETARKDVESQYQTGMLQLQQSKQSAMAKIQSDFVNAISQINNMRAQTEQAKGQAKLQALQSLRNEAIQVEQQATQFEQQLALMREQANLNIEQYAKTTGAAQTAGNTASSTFSNYAMTPAQYSQVQNQMGNSNFSGQYIGSISKPEEWQYQGAIKKAVVGRLPDGRALYSDGSAGWSY